MNKSSSNVAFNSFSRYVSDIFGIYNSFPRKNLNTAFKANSFTQKPLQLQNLTTLLYTNYSLSDYL